MSLLHRPFAYEKPSGEPSRGWLFLKRAVLFLFKLCFLALCAAGTAVLFKLSYPKPSHSLLAWLALAPFALAVTRLRSFWGTFFYSWLCGCLVYAGLYYWIFVTCWAGGGLSYSLALAAWLGLSALMAVQFAVFGGSCYYLKRLQWVYPVLAALGWASLEWAHEMLATYALGFPWVSLAYSQWNLPEVLQIASFTGACGVSAVVALTGLCVGYAFATPHLKRGVIQIVLAAAVFGGVYGYGAWVLHRPAPRALLSLRAAVLQPNIDQYKKWSPEFEQEIVDSLETMGRQLPQENVMLAVWPESVTPGPVQQPPYDELMRRLAQSSGAWQLVGSNRQEDGRQYVSAFLFSPVGEELPYYDKTHLVPFGEFIPLESALRRWFPQVQVLGELGGFTPGKWEQPLLQTGQIPFGVSICYESLFPTLWRRQAKQGAKFFVQITNDAWFFDTDAPYQHLAVAVVRAVELRRPVLRAANTGISAVIAPTGRLLARAELNTQAVLTANTALPLGQQTSFYVDWGDWFAWVCAAIYFTILLSVMVFAYE